jgi:hypothetical protein
MTLKISDNGVSRDATPEEIAQAKIDAEEFRAFRLASARNKRNQLLAETDWTQAKDVPDAVSSKWAPYRQALRDVPQQAGFSDNVTWPTKPE